jgi:hypothetical protein
MRRIRSADFRSSRWASDRLWPGSGSRLWSKPAGFTRHGIEIERLTRKVV